MSKWIKIAESAAELRFNENHMAHVETSERSICVGRFQGGLFAFAAKCPHAGALLQDGYIDVQGNVVCPLHRYKFSIKNGRNITGEGYYLKHWPVEEREDGVYVFMEEKRLFGLW